MIAATMFERYNEKARRVIFLARALAGDLSSYSIEPEHLLLAMLREDRELFDATVSEPQFAALVGDLEASVRADSDLAASADMPVSDSGRRILSLAAEETAQLGDAEIRPSHLLAAIFHAGETPAAAILRSHGFGRREATLVFVASSNLPSPKG